MKKVILLKTDGNVLGYDTIQAAVNAGASGDCVIVYPGTYDQGSSSLIIKDGVDIECIGKVTISSSNATGTIVDNNVAAVMSLKGFPTITNSNGLDKRIVLANAGSIIGGGLKQPSPLITVGANNCDFDSLSDALTAAPAGATIMVYPGTYTGQLILRPNQNLVAIGKVTLVCPADGVLFKIYGIDQEDFHAYFNGDFDYKIKYGYWPFEIFVEESATPEILNASLFLHGVEFKSQFHITQSSTNDPTITEVVRNFDFIDGSHPISGSRNGQGDFYFFDVIPPELPGNQKYIIATINSTADNRIIFFNVGAGEYWNFALSVKDFSGQAADAFSANVICHSGIWDIEIA